MIPETRESDMRWMMVVCLATLAACSSATKPEVVASPEPDTAVTPEVAPADPNCAVSFGGWCPSPPGDPCGAHKNEADCRADKACVGMPYLGESVVPCMPDGKGFSSNCPAVGCVSKP